MVMRGVRTWGGVPRLGDDVRMGERHLENTEMKGLVSHLDWPACQGCSRLWS